MRERLLLLAGLLHAWGLAQTICPPTPAYTPCEIVFEMSPEEIRSHPNPYLNVVLEVEFRSPRYRTFLMPGFWDGGGRMVVRFAPTEPGAWDFRVSTNLVRYDGKTGRVQATASDSPGFVRPRNVHHWGFTETDRPHLWMGDTCFRFAFMDDDSFSKLVAARARQGFNHIRGLVIGEAGDSARVFPSPDQPNVEHFQQLDGRILAMNKVGIVADLILAGPGNHLVRLFPARQQRERLVRFLVARYAAMHITWQGVQAFETYDNGRELLGEVGALLKKLDPYNHPRSSDAQATTGPLAADGWLTYFVHNSGDSQLTAIEHQLHPMPFVNVGFAAEDSGAGSSQPRDVSSDAFRRRLWNSTMDGSYPTFANTGTRGTAGSPTDLKYLDSPGARQMKVWQDFLLGTRHWELEPYFDVDGGRALALEVPREEENPEGIEYIVYVEKPGPVEIVLQRHNYDVAWINPITGQRLKQKDFRGDRLKLQPPDAAHDWVLHVSRESKKEGMLRSYKFETHSILLQEVEQSPPRVPYEIVEPSTDTLVSGKTSRFAGKVTRETRATRSMMWLWTGEVSADGRGYRVLGTGREGEMTVPSGLTGRYPAVLNLRLTGMNANGKIYFLDRIYRLTE
ncbi:MAG: DUF5060 domain-containing protein [Bryobacteraceae bacterium]